MTKVRCHFRFLNHILSIERPLLTLHTRYNIFFFFAKPQDITFTYKIYGLSKMKVLVFFLQDDALSFISFSIPFFLLVVKCC